MDQDNQESPFPVDLGYLGRDFPFLVRSLRGYVRTVTAQAFADLETEPGEIAILNLVAINPGLSQNDLAAILVMTKPAVTKAANALERRGLITRRKGRDRRFNAVRLTPAGEARVSLFRERMAVQHRVIFEGFSEGEETVFFERLRRILARLYEVDRQRALHDGRSRSPDEQQKHIRDDGNEQSTERHPDKKEFSPRDR